MQKLTEHESGVNHSSNPVLRTDLNESLNALSLQVQENAKIMEYAASLNSRFSDKPTAAIDVINAIKLISESMQKVVKDLDPAKQHQITAKQRQLTTENQKTIINILDTTNSFKENSNSIRFILGIAMIADAVTGDNTQYNALLRNTLETINSVFRIFINQGKEETAAKAVYEDIPVAASTFRRPDLVKDMAELYKKLLISTTSTATNGFNANGSNK